MNELRRYWNQNRNRLITGIAILAFLIILVRILNAVAKEENKRQNQNRVVLTEEEKKLPTKSIIGSGNVSVKTAKEDVMQIEQFVNYCNDSEYEKAYDMLTSGCKKALYSNVDQFIEWYCKPIFNVRKITDIKNYTSESKRDIYQVNLYEDMLATGNVNAKNAFTDYITVDRNDNNKLNVRGLIYRNSFNISSEYGGIKITVLTRDMYKDKEEFLVRVENNSENEILINSSSSEEGVYGIGNNSTSYRSNVLSMPVNERRVSIGEEKEYKIVFNKTFSSGVKIKTIAFADIVADYEKYQEDPNSVNLRTQIFINL